MLSARNMDSSLRLLSHLGKIRRELANDTSEDDTLILESLEKELNKSIGPNVEFKNKLGKLQKLAASITAIPNSVPFTSQHSDNEIIDSNH